MKTDRAARLLFVALVALFGTGCIGARTTVVADTSRYPVSLSGSVRDADGKVAKGDDLESAGSFHAESVAWGLLYSGIPLTPTTDMSRAVNEELTRKHGDAIVNLRVMTTQCVLDWVPLVNIVPFWPGCANVVIEGDIVRVRRARVASAVEAGRVR